MEETDNVRQVQVKILDIMKYIDKLCRKHGIVYYIMGKGADNYSSAVRKVMYTTNAVESINFSFRKVTKKEQAHCIHRLILFQFLS